MAALVRPKSNRRDIVSNLYIGPAFERLPGSQCFHRYASDDDAHKIRMRCYGLRKAFQMRPNEEIWDKE